MSPQTAFMPAFSREIYCRFSGLARHCLPISRAQAAILEPLESLAGPEQATCQRLEINLVLV